jgi:hypothetical protein
MEEFFASLYEWFGIIPFYSTDMGDLLRGWDDTCTDYVGTHWYVLIGWFMIFSTGLFYALQYHIIDSSRLKSKTHWWLFSLIIVLLNFLVAFLIPYNSIQASDYCYELNISVSDCIGFGLSNAVWSFILFTVITSTPIFRRFSTNCRYTTFWKP